MSTIVGLVPFADELRADALFDAGSPLNRDDVLRPWRELRTRAAKRGIVVHTADVASDPNALVSFDSVPRRPQVPWLLYIFEPPVVRPDLYRDFDALASRAARVFTHSPELATRHPNARFFSYPHPAPLHLLDEERPRSGLIAFMNANKKPAAREGELYTTRVRIAHWLARKDLIDVYGPGWDRTLLVYARWTRQVRRRWRGIAPSKYEVLGRYDFCLAFENAIRPGYITEKVFDPMFVGTIPIYLGAPEIGEVLPAKTFIDYRDIRTPERLLELLTSMDAEEKQRRREAMADFLRGEGFAARFGVDAWADQLLDELEEVLA